MHYCVKTLKTGYNHLMYTLIYNKMLLLLLLLTIFWNQILHLHSLLTEIRLTFGVFAEFSSFESFWDKDTG